MKILVYDFDAYEAAALIKDDELMDLAVESKINPSQVGAIRQGRIVSRRPHTHIYFVDIGGAKPAFLEASPGEKFREGQAIHVEILRDGFKDKEPKVKATEHPLRAPVSPILDFLAFHKALPMTFQMSPSSALYRKLYPQGELAKAAGPLFEEFDIRENLEELTSREMTAAEGFSIVFENLETVSFIDVNAGASALNNQEINLKAATLICRQIFLRNLSGLIVIDFLNMARPQKRQEVREILSQQAAKDRQAPRLLEFTRGGLFEMIRPRRYRPLAEIL